MDTSENVLEDERYKAMCYRAKHSPIKERRHWYYENHPLDEDAKTDEWAEIRTLYYIQNPQDSDRCHDEEVMKVISKR